MAYAVRSLFYRNHISLHRCAHMCMFKEKMYDVKQGEQ